MPKSISEPTRIPLGIYQGLRFRIAQHPQFAPEVYLEGATSRRYTLSRDHKGPRAVLNALERLATGYGSDCVRVRQDLSIAESQLRDYQERLGKPFGLEAYLTELTALRDQLKAGLSASGHEAERDEGPEVSEIAARIKALTATNTIEATSHRVQRKESTAQEPITARIRRRQEANAEAGKPIQANGEPAGGDLSSPDAFDKPNLSFQKRILRER